MNVHGDKTRDCCLLSLNLLLEGMERIRAELKDTEITGLRNKKALRDEK